MARVYALMSSFCSLFYLVGCVASVILLFTRWKLAIIVFVASVVFAFLAKFFDKAKMRQVYGESLGDKLAEIDWEDGKREAMQRSSVDRTIWDDRKTNRDIEEDEN